MSARVSIRDVLVEAQQAGIVGAEAEAPARAALVQLAAEDLPWYLRLLAGGAAWVAALFLLSLLLGLVAAIIGERVDVAALALGLVLVPAGLWFGRARRGGEFRRQFSLVCVLAGQMCLVGGIGGNASSITAAAVATMLSSVMILPFFDEPAYRFMATLAIVGAGLALGIDGRVPGTLGIAAAVTAAVAMGAWGGGAPLLQWHRLLDPIAWACVVACIALLGLQGVLDVVVGDRGAPTGLTHVLLRSRWLLVLWFSVALVGLAVRVARDHATPVSAPTVLAAIGVVLVVGLLTTSVPAVTGTLLFTALGFDRRRPGLMGLAAAGLIGALGLYYYDLALTLLQKSLLLMASGLVCLAAAAFFRQRAQEPTP